MTYPNVLALSYLKQTKKATPEVQIKAEQYINLGYQRLLTFETAGGGFDWYGNPPAKTILTAYGLLEINDMSKVYPVDEGLIERAKQLLLHRQQGDGSWEYEDPPHSWHGVNGKLPATAYVVWALAEAGQKNGAVKRGVDYISEHLEEAKDPYILALCANALVAADPEVRQNATGTALDRLNEMKQVKEKAAFWKCNLQTFYYATEQNASIETTALAAYSLIRAGRHSETATQALTYLVQSKDKSGVWGSTQATILALKALLAGAGGVTAKGDAQVIVRVNGKEATTVKLTEETSDVMQVVDLTEFASPGNHKIQLHLQGNAKPMYQVVNKYYLPWSQVPEAKTSPPMKIDLGYDRTNLRVNDTVTCRCQVRYLKETPTYMVIVDLGIPPGFAVVSEDLDALVKQKVIDRYELTGRQIIVYLGEVSEEKPVRFTYRLRARLPIRAKTIPSRAYEYYTPDAEATAAPTRIEVRS